MVSVSRMGRTASEARYIAPATAGDIELGLLKHLPGKWRNTKELNGRGWNMIALPFVSKTFDFNYRLLLNQYNEALNFTVADKGVKNRGVRLNGKSINTDQVLVALDYEQRIRQLAAEDFPVSTLAGGPCLAIHHEPGLWLVARDQLPGTPLAASQPSVDQSDAHSSLARLATIPHGNSLLAMGPGDEETNIFDGPPKIPFANGLPSGASEEMKAKGYLDPYKHFDASPFKGVQGPNFPGFNPTKPHELLIGSVPGTVKRTTQLKVSTKIEAGGILNIPFIKRQADATEMKSTFWIMELNELNEAGKPRLIMQYLQEIVLEFFDRQDGVPGLARWPHVSINTLERISDRVECSMQHEDMDCFREEDAG